MMLAMGGTRTFHRLVVAIEDAGWEVRDSMAWLYGSGFPKSYDISKGIDKQAGAQREVVGYYESPEGTTGWRGQNKVGAVDFGASRYEDGERRPLTAPSTPEAQLWHGWGTALKPAMELICVAMKPIDGTFVNNALTWGVAGLWIDGGRVEGEGGGTHCNNRDANGKCLGHPDRTGTAFGLTYHAGEGNGNQGRFPANVIHDGSDEVTGLFPNVKSGGSGKDSIRTQADNSFLGTGFGGRGIQSDISPSSGSAARFFYCAKSSRSERNAGLEGMEERGDSYKMRNSNGESDGWGNKFETKPMQNHHPTVKPLALMRYLARLTKTPTGGVVLDPFMGSGTTGMAAVLEGRDFIGIELDPEYLEIAQRRIEYWQKQMQPRLL
jgi:hypothetical protein